MPTKLKATLAAGDPRRQPVRVPTQPAPDDAAGAGGTPPNVVPHPTLASLAADVTKLTLALVEMNRTVTGLAGMIRQKARPPQSAPSEAKGALLYGATAIGAFLGITRRQAFHLIEDAGLPTFKIGKSVCATREDVTAWLAARRGGAA